jgi:2-furoyl-CoA dehydrogenase FAD binding subunit
VKSAAFEYCQADTLAEALELLAELGQDANVLAGGLSLGAMLNMRLARPSAVVDIKRIPALDAIETQGEIRTGATLTQAGAMENAALMQAVPLLALALPCVGHFQTRNRGTLCGSVAHADPSAEIPLVLATLGAEVELQSVRGVRRLPAADFLVDALTTARAADELITALVWPQRRRGARYGFSEIAQRHGDFAIVACAAEVVIDSAGKLSSLSFGLGGVETRPWILHAEAFAGAPADAALAARIAEEAARRVQPLHDYKASAEYRRALVRALGAQVLAQAFQCAD